MSEVLLTAPPARRAPGSAAPGEGPLAAALLAAADADADALADALHDGALQALVVARYAADAAVRGGDPLLVREAVQDALLALRSAVWLLRPRPTDLATSLAELSDRGPVPLRTGLDADVAEALPPLARAAAYRFVQVAGAAASGPVAVSLSRQGGWAVLSVDGRIADVAGWSARARALGGRLDLPGDPARLLLPLPDFDPEGAR